MSCACVITTIQAPTDAVKQWMRRPLEMIIIGDRKTPNKEWENERVRFFPFSSEDHWGVDNYARKCIGYIEAYQRGYDVFETDDDTFPLDSFQIPTDIEQEGNLVVSNSGWFNIYQYLRPSAPIWPRGYPHNMLNRRDESIQFRLWTKRDCPFKTFMINGHPDVDAMWRLMYGHNTEVRFNHAGTLIPEKDTWIPFNTQATWIQNDYLWLAYVPLYCDWRADDIIRGYVATAVLQSIDRSIAFCEPHVFQVRNKHDIINDLQKEFSLYTHADLIRQHLIRRLAKVGGDSHQRMRLCYQELVTMGVIQSKFELARLDEYLEYFR